MAPGAPGKADVSAQPGLPVHRTPSVPVPCSLGLTEELVSEIQVRLILAFLSDVYVKIKN